jgi:MFS family permease
MIGVGVVAFVSAPLQWLAPVVARDLFDATATRYGLLLGAMGIGSVLGAALLLSADRGVDHSRLVAIGFAAFAASIAGLALSPVYALGLASMGASGAAFIVLSSAHNNSVQAQCEDRLRGRVLALWMMQFGLLAPLGVLSQGALADVVGIRWVLLADAGLLAGYLVWVRASGLLAHLDGVGRGAAQARRDDEG